jgi:hypothetical protein
VATAAKANVAWNVDHSSCFFLCRGGRPQLGQSNQRSAHLGWSATVRVVGKNDSLPRRSDLYPESSSTPSDLLQERIHDALVLYPPADALTLPRALINCRDEYLTVEFMTVLITVLLLHYATVSVLCNQILDSMALFGGAFVQYCVAIRVQTFPL